MIIIIIMMMIAVITIIASAYMYRWRVLFFGLFVTHLNLYYAFVSPQYPSVTNLETNTTTKRFPLTLILAVRKGSHLAMSSSSFPAFGGFMVFVGAFRIPAGRSAGK